MEIIAPPGMEEITNQLQGMFQNLGQKQKPEAQDQGRRGHEGADRRGSRPAWSTRKS
jgi:hypothetical protein